MEMLGKIREDACKKIEGDTLVTNKLMKNLDGLMKEWGNKSSDASILKLSPGAF